MPTITPDELVESYVKRHKTFASSLEPWTPHILACLRRRMSYREITKFLSEQSVKTTHSSVYRFVHAKKRAQLFQQNLASQPQQSTRTNAEQAQNPSPSAQTEYNPPRKPANTDGVIPKFEWNPDQDRGKKNAW
jgi:IS30 family transposase